MTVYIENLKQAIKQKSRSNKWVYQGFTIEGQLNFYMLATKSWKIEF